MSARPSDAAQTLLSGAILCDMTLPWGAANENKEQALERFIASGFTFVSFTVGMDWVTLEETVRHIGAERRRFLGQPDRFVLVETAADIRRAKAEGKFAAGFHFQGTRPLHRDLNMVEVYYRLGVRHMLLAYNEKNEVGDGCHERTDAGLSRFGIALVQEMNRVGMLVDCTHTGYRTTMEAMECSSAPCIFSHSVAKALNDHDRNITDDQIRACAATGGVIGMNGVGMFLADNRASPEILADHIDHVAGLVGPQHVGLGLDYVYYMASMEARWRANPDRYARGYPEPPWHFFAPEDLPALVDVLLERGYGEPEIRGILGENYLRVAQAVWK
ncbi:MAG: dipeptidase [Sneathiellaceae bacterium]